MKKALLSSLILISGVTASFGQRLVLLEHFTQASCGPCASQNPALNALLDNNTTKVVAIKYQTSWPGTDPMNAANPTDVASRVTYYNVTGVPNSVMDGNFYNGSPGGVNQTNINTRNSAAPGVITKVSYTVRDNVAPMNDSMIVTATVKATSQVPAGYILHTVAIEREIEFASAPGTNGEKKFESVMKKMLPTASGTTLPAIAAGDSVSYTYKFSLVRANGTDVYYNLGQASAVAFVQNNSTKEVLGASYDEPRPWLAVARATGQKAVRMKAGTDLTFDFAATSKTTVDQKIKAKATITGLPAGWTTSIVSDGITYTETDSIPLPANSTKNIQLVVSGPNDAVLNKKVAIKVETNSYSILPGVKNTLNFTAVTPSNILFLDIAGTAAARFTAGFTAASQQYCSLTSEESGNLDSASLNPSSVKKIYYTTGASYSGTLTAEKAAVFTNYLNAGGNMFVMGQDIGYEVDGVGDPDALEFYNAILGAEYVGDGATTAVAVVKVEDDLIIAPPLTSSITLAAGSTSYPDQLAVSGSSAGVAFLNYLQTDNVAAIYNEGSNWKTVYVGFRMEAISSVPYRNALIARTNAWFDNTLTGTELKEQMAAFAPAFPNPAKSKLFVPVGGGSGNIVLQNIAGKVIREVRMNNSQSSMETLSLEGIPSGIYFLQTSSNGTLMPVQKIVVE
jgi:hypothetical protein